MDQELLALASPPPDKPRRQQQQQPEEDDEEEDGSKTAGGAGAKGGIDLAGADEAAAFAARMRQQVGRCGLCGPLG